MVRLKNTHFWQKARTQYLAASLFRRRLMILVLVFCVGLAGLVLRLSDVQIVNSARISEVAKQFRTHTYTLHAKRGDILDANGQILATTVERYNVAVNQILIEKYVVRNSKNEIIATGAAAAAEKLAPILDMDEAELGGKMLGGKKKSTFVYLKKDVSPDTWKKIAELRIPGIEPEQYIKRVYPNGNIAGNILGYVGETEDEPGIQKGQSGIESTQDKLLRGTDGSGSVQVVSGSTQLPTSDKEEKPAIDGATVTLTIDRDLQAVAQEAIDTQVNKYHAEWGSAVLLEVGTNRVLAMADSATPDPGNLQKSDSSNWGIRSIQYALEPGSSGKVVTYSAAINEGKITPLSIFTDPYQITMPNGQTFHDALPHPTAEMTVNGILINSYNTGLIQVGDLISDEVRYSYMKNFGLGSPTGIELPAESAGYIGDYQTWDGRTRYTTMFGQGIALTPLQLAAMASVVANKGVYVPPHIIESVTSPDGTITPTAVGESRQVISEETAQEMTSMMMGVMVKGEATPGAIEGYTTAGKTGTAEVAGEDGRLTKRVGTFVGFVPADNPRFVVSVAIFNPDPPGYGGYTASPAFKKIGQAALRVFGVSPSGAPQTVLPMYKNEVGN